VGLLRLLIPRARIVYLVVGVLVGASCSVAHTHPSGLYVCGHPLHIGPAEPILQPLRAPTATEAAAAPPAGQRLPPLRPDPNAFGDYVRVSSDCQLGDQVITDPVAGTRLLSLITDSRGGVVALGLQPANGAHVRLWVYHDGRLTGTLLLD